MATTEEQKKAILPFLQRADEIDKVEPKVAYYCRLYAIQQGLELKQRDPQIDGVLTALVAKLEKDKPHVRLGENDKDVCEQFALTVFSRADRIDRAGQANKDTSMTFYAASIFFEVCKQFGELLPDMLDMQKYAAWKAADIRKALREGRTPLAGPPGKDSASSQASGSLPSLPDVPGGPPGAALRGPPSAPADIPGQRGAGAHYPMPPADEADTAPADTTATEGGRFEPGALVWVDAGGPVPVRGTVVKSVPGGPGAAPLHMVAVAREVLTVPSERLAPDWEPGQRVLVQPAGGGAPEEACIVKTDASHWRPSYHISAPDGSHLRTADNAHLSALAAEPLAALLPAGVTPPGIAAPPPHPDAPPAEPPTVRYADEATPFADPPPGPAGRPAAQEPPAQRPPAPTFSAPAPMQPLPMPTNLTPPASSISAALGGPPGVGQSAFQPSLAAITEAQKYAKYAASSLGFEDVKTATRYLSDALRLLTQPSATPPHAQR